jgi:hypothetical protein
MWASALTLVLPSKFRNEIGKILPTDKEQKELDEKREIEMEQHWEREAEMAVKDNASPTLIQAFKMATSFDEAMSPDPWSVDADDKLLELVEFLRYEHTQEAVGSTKPEWSTDAGILVREIETLLLNPKQPLWSLFKVRRMISTLFVPEFHRRPLCSRATSVLYPKHTTEQCTSDDGGKLAF